MSYIDKRSDGYYINPLPQLDKARAEIERAKIDRYLHFRVMKKLQIPHHIYSLAMVPIMISGVFVGLMINDGTILVGLIAIAVCLLVMIGLIVTGRRTVSRKMARRTELSSQIESYVRIPDALVDNVEIYNDTYPNDHYWCGDTLETLANMERWDTERFWHTVDLHNRVQDADAHSPNESARLASMEFHKMWDLLYGTSKAR